MLTRGNCKVIFTERTNSYDIFLEQRKITSTHTEICMENICNIINTTIDVWETINNKK